MQERNGSTLMEADGVVDPLTYAPLQMKLHSLLRTSDVVLDLSRVDVLSSSGLGALVAAVEAGDESGNRLFLLRPSRIVRLAIESSGFAHLFTVVESPEEAD